MQNLPTLLKLARNVSKHSKFRVRVGAVLVDKGHPISVGFNKAKYNSEFSHITEQSIHAEMQALKTSGKEFINKSIMFVYRETKDGKTALSRPCEKCLKRLQEFGVKKIIYSVSEYPYFAIENI